jgi:hypothetical protein
VEKCAGTALPTPVARPRAWPPWAKKLTARGAGGPLTGSTGAVAGSSGFGLRWRCCPWDSPGCRVARPQGFVDEELLQRRPHCRGVVGCFGLYKD